MSIASIDLNRKGNFYAEIPTIKPNQKMLIDSSEKGLKIYVEEGQKIYSVERYMIDGLPKEKLIPEEFFENCFVTVKHLHPEGIKVQFSIRGRGGMQETTQQQGGDGAKMVAGDIKTGGGDAHIGDKHTHHHAGGKTVQQQGGDGAKQIAGDIHTGGGDFSM